MVPGYDSRQARWKIQGLTKPDPKEQAAQIVAWAICWPWNVVWTLCVYNPFRYVGEFLLQELQSALFEISNGQFSEIERDLSLEAERQSSEQQAAALPEESVRQSTATDRPHSHKHTAGPAPAISAEIPRNQQTSIERVQQSATTPPASDWSIPPSAAAQPSGHQNGAVTAATAKASQQVPADTYVWTPPAPSSHFSIADTPLRAVKPGNNGELPGTSALTDSTTSEPEVDPWLQSHSGKK